MKNIKKYLIGFCALAMSLAFSVGIANSLAYNDHTVVAEVTTEESVVLAEEYEYNTIFTLPSCSFTKDGETKTAETLLISPVGYVYNDEKVTLAETGVWTVRYTVSFDKEYVEEKQFTVYKPTYEVDPEKDDISYGENPVLTQSGSGLNLTLSQGSTFQYNRVINLNGMKSTDVLIQFGLSPAAIGVADIASVYLRLTDIYDPSNYVYVWFSDINALSPNSYLDLAAAKAGFSQSNVAIGHYQLAKEVNSYAVSTNGNNLNGTHTALSFLGYTAQSNKTGGFKKGDDMLTSISYDYETAQVHCRSKFLYGTQATGVHKTLIADLDEFDYAGNNSSISNPWEENFKGFTTGEVYLSMYCEGYSGGTAGIFIKSIYGADLAEDGKDFTILKSYDELKPNLNVDTQGFGESELPVAKVGVPYPLFSATASDNETKDLKISQKVYYMCENTLITRMSIIDGKFTPFVAGKYCIEYSVKDGYGNSVVKKYYVYAQDTVNNPEITLEDGYLVEGTTGEKISLATYSALAYSGNVSNSVAVMLGEKVVAENVSYFQPMQSGTYLVKYTAKDYLGQETTVSYNIQVSTSVKPYVETEPSFPYGFIHGATYDLPVMEAYDFVGQNYVPAKITVTDENGAQVLQGGKYIAYANEATTVNIKYEFVGAEGATVYTYELPIIKIVTYKNDLINYFLCDENVTATQEDEGVALHFANSGEVKFVKYLPVLSTKIAWTVFADAEGVYQNNVEEVNLYLADDVSVLKITIYAKEDGTSQIAVNDGSRYDFGGKFNAETNFSFEYDNKNKALRVDESTTIYIKEDLAGNVFNGFINNRAKLTISATVANADSELNFVMLLKQISAQYFVKERSEYIGPEMTINGETNVYYEKGTVVQSFTALAYDVLQENSTCLLTVMSPSGNIATDVNGVQLKGVDASVSYQIELSEYGLYNFRYEAKDSLGNKSQRVLSYNVLDVVAPTVEVKQSKIICRVNETVALPVAKISDNVTEIGNLEGVISYTDTEGRILVAAYLVRSDKTNLARNEIQANEAGEISCSFTFTQVGTWKITYLVFDAAYNITLQEVTVIVEA